MYNPESTKCFNPIKLAGITLGVASIVALSQWPFAASSHSGSNSQPSCEFNNSITQEQIIDAGIQAELRKIFDAHERGQSINATQHYMNIDELGLNVSVFQTDALNAIESLTGIQTSEFTVLINTLLERVITTYPLQRWLADRGYEREVKCSELSVTV